MSARVKPVAARQATTGKELKLVPAELQSLVVAAASGDGLTKVQQAQVAKVAQKMRRVAKTAQVAFDEAGRVQEYGMFKIASTATSIGFIVQLAEMNGALSSEAMAHLQASNREWLAVMAEIAGDTTTHILQLAKKYQDSEPGFREFLVAWASGDIDI